MYEFFLSNGLWLVLSIALVVWAGIAWYLNRLDNKVSVLEQELVKLGLSKQK